MIPSMLGLYVHLGPERSQRMEFGGKQAIAIGSDGHNDLVLRDGQVPPFHCRLVCSGGRWFLAPPEEHDPAPAPRPLEDGAELVAGAYTIVLSIPPPPEPVEQALLDQIAAGDEASRLVYADWLEDRGDTARAEFLRLQQALAGIDPVDVATRLRLKDELRRLRELGNRLDSGWRQLVGRPAVEGCRQATFDFRCSMDWGKLAPTDRPGVRRCGSCGDDVYFTTSVREARGHARLGRCVAIDLSVARAPGDLQEPEVGGRRSVGAAGEDRPVVLGAIA